ncbi:MAG: protein kinase [Bacteroidales bacterium]|nr:protein kinase [Bacteroidales bacterium]
MGCIFTLKILYRISKPERVTKFLHEVAFVQECSFPTILKQYDDGEWYNHPFVVMDYMSTTLEVVIKKGELTIGDKILFSLQLLSAAKYLQSKNVVHRDIKPSNIFIKDNTAILGDFGLIKELSDTTTDDREEIKGYYAMPGAYRTPELVAYARSESPICKESDIFQLGLVLCELFTGNNPLRPSVDSLSDVTLLPIPNGKSKHLKKCIGIIRQMLKKDKTERMTVDKAMERFNMLFEEYARAREELEGAAI